MTEIKDYVKKHLVGYTTITIVLMVAETIFLNIFPEEPDYLPTIIAIVPTLVIYFIPLANLIVMITIFVKISRINYVVITNVSLRSTAYNIIVVTASLLSGFCSALVLFYFLINFKSTTHLDVLLYLNSILFYIAFSAINYAIFSNYIGEPSEKELEIIKKREVKEKEKLLQSQNWVTIKVNEDIMPGYIRVRKSGTPSFVAKNRGYKIRYIDIDNNVERIYVDEYETVSFVNCILDNTDISKEQLVDKSGNADDLLSANDNDEFTYDVNTDITVKYEAAAKEEDNDLKKSAKVTIKKHVPEVHEEKVKFCRKCGAELVDGAMFCKKCGTKVINTK